MTVVCVFVFYIHAPAQQNFSGSNRCVIRITTNEKDREFSSSRMEARLNVSLGRFEFNIPARSLQAMQDSTDYGFLNELTEDNDFITINASLPNDHDPSTDLSYFRGNRPMYLGGEVRIGNRIFKADIAFKGMLMSNNQTLALDLNAFLGERSLPVIKIGKERVIEIEISALGDKVIGLTSNQ
jgi:hypothetical protein